MKNKDEDSGDWIREIVNCIVDGIGFICLLIFYAITILPFCIIVAIIFGLPCALLMCLEEKLFWGIVKIKGKYPSFPSSKKSYDVLDYRYFNLYCAFWCAVCSFCS